MSTTRQQKVAYIYNKAYIKNSDDFIPTKNRNQMVHSLIKACDLLKEMTLVAPKMATFDDLATFHCRDYLECMLSEEEDSDDESNSEKLEEFGFGYDCPLRENTFEYCSNIGGGSLTAASLLCSKDFSVAIHWLGGWHHAKRYKASGYCYVNDCVLAILRMSQTFRRILYIDLDLHHGDGVEEAFSGSSRVMTFSVHNFDKGFFPGTGDLDDIGCGRGKFHSVNLPLKEGASDEMFESYTKKALKSVKEHFNPEAIVCQLGADGLNEDPMKAFNLTPASFVSLLRFILDWNLPSLLLGGGGYNEANVARCWCQLTACAVGKTLPEEIPEHDFFDCYGPGFEFNLSSSMRKDLNSVDYLDDVISSIDENLKSISLS